MTNEQMLDLAKSLLAELEAARAAAKLLVDELKNIANTKQQ